MNALTPFEAQRAWDMLCQRLQRDPAISEETDTCTLRAAWRAMLAFHAASDRIPAVQAVRHPMADASLVEVLDYAALRLSETRTDAREWQLATDRLDEAYMWVVAATGPSA